MARTNRRGLTLVEMLVAMAISLIMIYGMVAAFARVGQEASDGRAKIEMANQMRNVLRRLELDLNGVTVPMRNWTSSGAAAGYFEYIEGAGDDNTGTVFGDRDDVLMFTARNAGEPFLGRQVLSGSVSSLESPVAEVIWSVQGSGTDARDYFLHRRALLVRPDLNGSSGFIVESVDTLANLETFAGNFLAANDISVRFSLTPDSGANYRLRIIANSLDTLTVRENRFAHRPLIYSGSALTDDVVNAAFPHLIYATFFAQAFPGGARLGETVMMSHAIAFDVRAYDPTAPLVVDDTTTASLVLGPSDPGFAAVSSNTVVGRGSFVDLAWAPGGGRVSAFDERPQTRSGLSTLPAAVVAGVYDTWTGYYESNSLDDDGDSLVDEGADGIDNNSSDGIDEPAERETLPPYLVPLRGLKVILRMYESDTRQVRQSAVVTDFVPE